MEQESVPSEWERSLKPSYGPVIIGVVIKGTESISYQWFHRHGDRIAPIPNALSIQTFN